MGLGTVVGDILTLGGTARRRNRRADAERAEADAISAQNTATAQQMMARDYGNSRLEGLNVTVAPNQRMMTEQNRVMGELRNISKEGFTATDRQALDEGQRRAMMSSRAEEQSQQQGALSAAAKRGDVRGSNALMASLAAQQGAANRESDASSRYATDVALAGRDRARGALSESGSMASQIRGQGVAEQQANVSNQMSQAGGIDSFGQWRAGQQSNDAAMLMNARSGQAQALNASADRRDAQFSDGLNDAIAVGGAIASVYTGGAAGAATGAASAAKSTAPSGAQQKGMQTPTASTQPAPAPTTPAAPATGGQAKGMVPASARVAAGSPAAAAGARTPPGPGAGFGGNIRNAVAAARAPAAPTAPSPARQAPANGIGSRMGAGMGNRMAGGPAMAAARPQAPSPAQAVASTYGGAAEQATNRAQTRARRQAAGRPAAPGRPQNAIANAFAAGRGTR